jgi:nucleoside-diphosphate-sugar epimerase
MMASLAAQDLPAGFLSVAELETFLSAPPPELIADLARVPGDILVLGVAGKMGPTLARMAKRAAPCKRVLGVARFSDPSVRRGLEVAGVETISCDLLDRGALAQLPRLDNVVYMAAMKFGASGNPALTWAMNVHVPALVAETFQSSRIVAFSTGCVYPFVPVTSGGASEDTPAEPPAGDYASSCVGRERMFEFFSAARGTPGRLLRLNYAIDMRYGVLHDIARKVLDGVPIDLSMGHVNVIWQGDANAVALRCLARVTNPTSPINVTGPQTLRVRQLAEALGQRLKRVPQFTGTEAKTGWLNNAGRMLAEFGPPRVPLEAMLDWTADWLLRGMVSHGKPTHYEVRDGRY